MDINKGLLDTWNRVNFLRRYLKVDGLSGTYQIGFLQNEGGLDNQEWEWLEDVTIICQIFNSLKK